MSIYFEIADISYELIDVTTDLLTWDVKHYFKSQKTDGFLPVRCHISFVEDYSPLQGDIVLRDPYRLVLNNNGTETRIFFANPFQDVYGVYREQSENEIIVETNRKIIDMHFLEILTFEKYLLRRQAFILHSCYVAYHKEGIAFTAPSGTGKSTQGALWEKYGHGEVVNGDRSILQYKDGKWFIHSLPFCGSSMTNKNKSYPLKSVVIVNRDCHDHIEKTTYETDYYRLLEEVTVNKWDPSSVEKITQLADRLFQDNKVINLYCTMNPEACYCLKNHLFGSKESHDRFQ